MTGLRYPCVIAVILYAFTCLAAASQDPNVKIIEKTKRSVVPIVCGYIDNQNHFQLVQIVGSGFFVDTLGRFITAAHVLDNWDTIGRERHPCTGAIYIPDHGWGKVEKNILFQSFSFVSCIRDLTIDLALCQPTENPFASGRVAKGNISPVSFDTREWPEGTPVAFSGFPLEYTFPLTSKGFVAGHMEIQNSNIGFDYVIDKSTWPGASGSLVYLGNGG